MFCPVCGNDAGNNNMCPYCGVNLGGINDQLRQNQQNQYPQQNQYAPQGQQNYYNQQSQYLQQGFAPPVPEKKNSSKKIIVIVVAAIAVIVIAIVGLFFIFSGNDSSDKSESSDSKEHVTQDSDNDNDSYFERSRDATLMNAGESLLEYLKSKYVEGNISISPGSTETIDLYAENREFCFDMSDGLAQYYDLIVEGSGIEGECKSDKTYRITITVGDDYTPTFTYELIG